MIMADMWMADANGWTYNPSVLAVSKLEANITDAESAFIK